MASFKTIEAAERTAIALHKEKVKQYELGAEEKEELKKIQATFTEKFSKEQLKEISLGIKEGLDVKKSMPTLKIRRK